jgi:AAA family ATP:ADP antiporter
MHRDRTRLCAIALGLATLAFIVAKTGRDALFFQGGDSLLQLPMIYINIGTASLPLALLFVRAMKRWGARAARLGILLFAAGVILSAAPFLRPGDNTPMLAMFMFIPAIFGPLFASLWLLASDLFEKIEKRDAARAFSKLGAATLAGGMAGGLLAKALAPLIDPKWLILLAAVMVFCVVLVVVSIHRRFPANVTPKKQDTGWSGIAAAISKRYALTLLFISMSGALAGLLIDFQFYAAAASARMGSAGNAAFFANFYILLNFSSLLLQLFLTPKVQDKLGVSGGLMILPFALIGGAAFASAAATAFSRSLLRVTEGGLRSSIHRSIWEQAFLPVESSERSIVKLVVDGIAARIAEAIGALVILLWLMQVVPAGKMEMPLDTAWMSWVILVTVVTWLLITHRLRTRADESTAEPTAQEPECERFPDQCPCTTELGKGIR